MYLFGSSTGATLTGNKTLDSSQYQPFGPTRGIIDSNYNLYITDTWNQQIQFWPNGGISGTTVAGITMDFQNHRIMSYASDANNSTLVIANFDDNNIVRYVLGGNGWTLVASDINETSRVTSIFFSGLLDITFDPMGNMYVADHSNHRIEKFLRY